MWRTTDVGCPLQTIAFNEDDSDVVFTARVVRCVYQTWVIACGSPAFCSMMLSICVEVTRSLKPSLQSKRAEAKENRHL